MTHHRNGTPANQLDTTWIRSSHSGQVGNCVEVGRLDTGDIAMRNSRHPDGPALVFTPAEIAAFVGGVGDGEFDDLTR